MHKNFASKAELQRDYEELKSISAVAMRHGTNWHRVRRQMDIYGVQSIEDELNIRRKSKKRRQPN